MVRLHVLAGMDKGQVYGVCPVLSGRLGDPPVAMLGCKAFLVNS